MLCCRTCARMVATGEERTWIGLTSSSPCAPLSCTTKTTKPRVRSVPNCTSHAGRWDACSNRPDSVGLCGSRSCIREPAGSYWNGDFVRQPRCGTRSSCQVWGCAPPTNYSHARPRLLRTTSPRCDRPPRCSEGAGAAPYTRSPPISTPGGQRESRSSRSTAGAGRKPRPGRAGTLEEVDSYLYAGWATGVQVVQINGGVSRNRRSGTAAATAAAIAQKGGGSVTLMPSPAILEHLSTKIAIERDRVVAGVIALARSSDVFLFSAGAADHGSVHIDSGYLTETDLDRLVANGAVGDVVGRYLNAAGHIVDSEIDNRTVGLTLDEIRAAHRTIAVIAGKSKHPVARAVVKSGLCTVLITDEGTALDLLDGPNRVTSTKKPTTQESQ